MSPIPQKRLRILFLCTGNSCRSQMAEGYARALRGDVLEPFSAGLEAHGQNPRALKVMAEAGVDISGQASTRLDELEQTGFDLVVTVCGHADEHCPVFPGAVPKVHQPFEDPPRLAAGLDDEEAILDCYRRVRDQIRDWVLALPENLEQQSD